MIGIALDGSSCWEARLGLSTVTRVVVMARGKPEDWALIFLGTIRSRNAATAPPEVDPYTDDVILQVTIQDGRIRYLNIAALNMRALAVNLMQ